MSPIKKEKKVKTDQSKKTAIRDASVAKPEKMVKKSDKGKEKAGKKTKTKEIDLDELFSNKQSSTKETKDEIDELFATKKPKTTTDTQEPSKEQSILADEDDFTDSRGLKKKRRPTTAEGFPIYTSIEMKVGLGGDTPECPFDCQCCF